MKKYKIDNHTFILRNEKETIFAIIAYSAIRHDNEIRPTFASFRALFKPRWSDNFMGLQAGEIRWDGMIHAEEEVEVHHQYLDDLLMKIMIEFMIYEIADQKIFKGIPLDNVNLDSLYYSLKHYEQYAPPIIEVLEIDSNDIKANYILAKNPEIQKLCDIAREDLTKMSSKAISDYEEGVTHEM